METPLENGNKCVSSDTNSALKQSSSSFTTTINRLVSPLRSAVDSEVDTTNKLKKTVNRLVSPLKTYTKKSDYASGQKKHALSPNDATTNPKKSKQKVRKNNKTKSPQSSVFVIASRLLMIKSTSSQVTKIILKNKIIFLMLYH